MDTILTETMRVHLEFTTIALAIHGKLDNSAETSTILRIAATRLGVDAIILEKRTASFNDGELHVMRNGEPLAIFRSSKAGELKLIPLPAKKAA